MSAPLAIGCLGAARITPPALVWPAKVRGDVRLVAVAAREEARAAAFAERHGFARAFGDYAALIADPEVTLVYNALPVNLHAPWTIKALEAGKHVLCEKPFAMSLAEAEVVDAAARAAGRRVIEAFHHRYHPTFAAYLALLPRIGRLRRFEASFTAPIPDRDGAEIRHLPETGGGAFMDLGCYCLAWLLASTPGEPTRIEAEAVRTARGVDESLTARLAFEDGLDATLTASMAPDASRGAWLSAEGEAGTIRFLNPLAPQMGSRLTIATDAGEQDLSPDDRLATYHYQLGAVAAALRTGEPLPTEGAAILRQQRLLDALYRAAGFPR